MMKTVLFAVTALAIGATSASAGSLPCPKTATPAACAAHQAYVLTLPAWNAVHPDKASVQVIQSDIKARNFGTDAG